MVEFVLTTRSDSRAVSSLLHRPPQLHADLRHDERGTALRLLQWGRALVSAEWAPAPSCGNATACEGSFEQLGFSRDRANVIMTDFIRNSLLAKDLERVPAITHHSTARGDDQTTWTRLGA